MQCIMTKPYELFFIRCCIKILHQPFLLSHVDFVKFSVLSLILGVCADIDREFDKMIDDLKINFSNLQSLINIVISSGYNC